MLERKLTSHLRKRLRSSPAAVLVGPRQCGKTTLARSLASRYYDLEQEQDRLKLDLEWEEVEKERGLVVLDEAQTWPQVFPRLRGAIDRERSRRGRFLLLGSVSPALMTEVAESLAGRLAVMELTPFLLAELPRAAARNRHWAVGGFPDGGVLAPNAFPQWQDDYLALLVQRDLPNWGLAARPQVTRRFLRMLAATHGQQWNASALGRSLGVSYHTVNSYLDYLEGAFLVRRLEPLQANVRKRLVKSPKIFVRDSGLLHSLLGVAQLGELLDKPWVGASWEGYVTEQILSHLGASRRRSEAFHLRTSDGKEIDLVIQMEGETWAIETKLTTSPSPQDLRKLDSVADLIDADRRFLIARVNEDLGDEQRGVRSLESLIGLLTSQ